MTRHHYSITLQQATLESPTLAKLSELTRESSARLAAILPLIPTGLHANITAGPIEGPSWCLLVKNAACAAKIKQLLPDLEKHLRSLGCDVMSIRLKIQQS